MAVKLNTNFVSIKPIDLHTRWEIEDEWEAMRHVSVMAEIVDCCKDLDFAVGEPELHWDNYPYYQLEQIRMSNEFGMERKTSIQVSPVDLVLFDYVSHLEADSENQYYWDEEDKILICTYDRLYFNLSTMTPLNGHCFVEPMPRQGLTHERNGFLVYSDLSKFEGIGHVKYGKFEGRLVRFPTMQVAPEYKYHQKMNPGGLPLLMVPEEEIIVCS